MTVKYLILLSIHRLYGALPLQVLQHPSFPVNLGAPQERCPLESASFGAGAPEGKVHYTDGGSTVILGIQQ